MHTLDFQWHLTNHCNLRCLHCYQDEFEDGSEPETIFSVAHRLLAELGAREIMTTLNLTGGEPFLLGEVLFSLLDLLEQAAQVQKVTIITNGLLLNEPLLHTLDNYTKLEALKVSLEGANASTNDCIRGKGVFHKVVERVRMTRKLTRKKLLFMFTAHRGNFEEIPQLLDWAQELGLDGVMIERFIPEGRGRQMSVETLGALEWKKLVQMIIDWSKIEVTPEDLLPYKAFLFELTPRITLWGARCNLGEAFCIMPDGMLLPCRRFVYPLGNILKEGLWPSIENHPFLVSLLRRDRLQGRCSRCQVAGCFGCRALTYALSRDPFAEDVQCFLAL